ncbi:MAG: hypothetical protein ABF608_07105 [Sporolactobacillus sp.]
MTELKPFTVDGNEITGEMLETMQKNGLTKGNVLSRVHYQKWTLEDAVSIPKGQKRPSQHTERKPLPNAIKSPVKHYYLSAEQLAEVHRKYGKPGELIKEYSQKKLPITLSGTWGA